MKLGKVIIAAALWLVVVCLGFWLYKIIQDPVQFEKDYQVRHSSSVERMEDIRTAQSYFLKSKGKYAGNFDELIASMKNDLISEVVIKGNPDDTSIVKQLEAASALSSLTSAPSSLIVDVFLPPGCFPYSSFESAGTSSNHLT